MPVEQFLRTFSKDENESFYVMHGGQLEMSPSRSPGLDPASEKQLSWSSYDSL
jgi:hypothetical protein